MIIITRLLVLQVSSDSGCAVKMTKVREGRSRQSPICTRLFKSSDSPLQPCFSRLDPAPFSQMCELDVVSANRAEREPECQAAEAYVEQCKFVGMEISMPQECSKFMFLINKVFSWYPAYNFTSSIWFDRKKAEMFFILHAQNKNWM